MFHPEAAESSKISTKWSSRRLTSSTYKLPLLAFASKPGSKALIPSVRAYSISIVPQTLSSVAPRGKSIIETFFLATFTGLPNSIDLLTSSLIKS